MKTNDNQMPFPAPGKTAREDTAQVMRFYGLAGKFPKAVLADARRAAAALNDIRPTKPSPGNPGRVDLRKKFIFTCDPETARDYDDALSLETDRGGNRVLGVHIADVAHFVKSGSALDREAFRRSTSVYLADRVVPMLPEELSNGVCSLVPGEPRLAFSVFMTFDEGGRMIKSEFTKSIICSKARLTYEQTMAIIAGGRPPAGISPRNGRIVREIARLAAQLRSRRFAAGALDLEVPEAEVLLDGEGEMTGIVTRPYDESHQMIEECMVAANEAVARELWTKGIKILARLHESPDLEKLEMLRADLLGLGVKTGDLSKPKVFERFLRQIKSHPLYSTISVMILRSMKKAVYDARSIGHFGLAKRYYAHFTSPIRRYPDLTLHRQLADYLVKPALARRPAQELSRWALHATECEQAAAEAERALVEIKKYRLLEAQLSSRQIVEYDAVVSKCTPFGCFVEIPEIAVSGLVHISVLAPSFVSFDETNHVLSARGGRSWRVGDRMKVHVAGVDFKQRRLDFVPCRP